MTLDDLAELEPWEWPEDAKAIILRVLDDTSAPADDRLLAAELGGNFVVVDDEIVDRILTILRNPEEEDELRGHAAIAFGPTLEVASTDSLDDPDDMPISERAYLEIQNTLRTMYTDTAAPKLVRRRALEAAVRAQEDWQVAAIASAYASGDAEWKLTAVFCMEHVRGFDKEIIESLQSDDDSIHYHAVRAAGSWELAQAWGHVCDLARSRSADVDVRIAAIEAVAMIHPDEAAPILAGLLEDPDDDVAAVASETLAVVGAMQEIEDEFDDDDRR